jgi:hypothetical protein
MRYSIHICSFLPLTWYAFNILQSDVSQANPDSKDRNVAILPGYYHIWQEVFIALAQISIVFNFLVCLCVCLSDVDVFVNLLLDFLTHDR